MSILSRITEHRKQHATSRKEFDDNKRQRLKKLKADNNKK